MTFLNGISLVFRITPFNNTNLQNLSYQLVQNTLRIYTYTFDILLTSDFICFSKIVLENSFLNLQWYNGCESFYTGIFNISIGIE